MFSSDRKIKEEIAGLFYDILCKQIEPLPKNTLFHKLSEKDIIDYWYPIIADIERLCKLTLAKPKKLRYINDVFKMPERGEFIKNFLDGE